MAFKLGDYSSCLRGNICGQCQKESSTQDLFCINNDLISINPKK